MSALNTPLMQQFALSAPLWQAPLPYGLIDALGGGKIRQAGALGMITLDPWSTVDAVREAARQFRQNSTQLAFCFTHPLPTPPRYPQNDAEERRFFAHFDPQLRIHAPAHYADLPALIEATLAEGAQLLGFANGIPERETIATLKARGIQTFAVVHSVAEALAAYDFALDILVLQGREAGGIHTRFSGQIQELSSTLTLLAQVRDLIDIPLVVWGDFPAGRDVLGALIAGAQAVMVDRPWLACADLPLTPAQREKITTDNETQNRISHIFSTAGMRHLESDLNFEGLDRFSGRDFLYHALFRAHPDWRVLPVSATPIPAQESIAALIKNYLDGIARHLS